MEHLLLKAAATVTDQGAFEAVISTEAIDREKDIVSADAMVAALRKWNRPIPLAWNHSTKAEDIFGHIDPASVKNVGGEVVAGGHVDLESTVGKEAWRSFKSRAIGFSFGYLILEATKRKGGGRAITGLDVFEITATPTPMNNDTRVLSTKAMSTADRRSMATRMHDMAAMMANDAMPMSEAEMASKMRAMAAEMAAAGKAKAIDSPPTATQLRILNSMVGQAQEYIASDPDAEDASEMAEVLATLEELRGEPDTEESDDQMMAVGKSVEMTGVEGPCEARSVDSLRKKSQKLALEIRTGGLSDQPPVKQAEPMPKPQPEMDPVALRKHSRDLMLQVLSGVETT